MVLPVRTLALLASLVAGCGSMPRHCVESSGARVCADDLAQAQALSVRLAEARAELARWLPDYREVELDVWVQDELDMGPFVEIGDENLGAMREWGGRANVRLLSSSPELVLVHEVVHASLGPSWEPLPDALEEGLCDVANQAFGDARVLRELRLRCAARTGAAACELRWRVPSDGPPLQGIARWDALGGSDASASTLTVEEILDAPGIRRFDGAEADHVYGVGYFCADRIVARHGVAGLHALCQRATREGLERVPSAWALAAAGFADGAQLEAAARAELWRVRVADVLLASAFWRTLRALIAEQEPPPGSPAELLERWAPELAFGDDAPVAFDALPGLRPALEARWSELVAPEGSAAE